MSARITIFWTNGSPILLGKTSPQQNQHTIITIAREYGSGGHLLGEMLSKELGIKLYDKEFIRMAAQRSGMDEQYIVRNEQSILLAEGILSKNSEQPLNPALQDCRCPLLNPKARLFRNWQPVNPASLSDGALISF